MNQKIRNIIVTGGNGKVGQQTVMNLHEHGYQVTSLDLAVGDRKYARQIKANLTDLGQVYGALRGQDAVIHLGAIPSPIIHPPEVVFQNNMMSTFNILEAACVLGIKHVVLAGSISALGFTFAHRPFIPDYIPIDEQHPLLPQDSYGISKALLEDLGAGFARRSPDMAITSLRFSIVLTAGEILRDIDNPPYNLATVLWSYIDVRDVADSCRMAIENAAPGFDAMFITAPDTLSRTPIRDLLDQAYPGIEKFAENFQPHDSAVSSKKAFDKLGFQAQYTWRKILDEKN